MKFFVVALFCLVVAQCYAYRDDSSEMEVSDDMWKQHFLQSSSRHHDESSVVRSFKKKISQRIAGSETIKNNSEYKDKIIQVAKEKLEKCETPSGDDYDRHCVGRATGQVMQFISSVENNNRRNNNNHHSSHNRNNQWKDSSENY
ncbi:uncharacterized protein [Musca autumnalis]|uniref:uncharacterized protein n=1 Tax=Musca autumnalis TaxID=221902 RepID=UPI003CF8E8F8